MDRKIFRLPLYGAEFAKRLRLKHMTVDLEPISSKMILRGLSPYALVELPPFC